MDIHPWGKSDGCSEFSVTTFPTSGSFETVANRHDLGGEHASSCNLTTTQMTITWIASDSNLNVKVYMRYPDGSTDTRNFYEGRNSEQDDNITMVIKASDFKKTVTTITYGWA